MGQYGDLKRVEHHSTLAGLFVLNLVLLQLQN